MVMFRQGRESDLIEAYAIYYANNGPEEQGAPSLSVIFPQALEHVLLTGTLWVAEEQGKILAFAGAVTRDEITFLTDLFVLPDQQSARLGQTLLQHVLPTRGIRCTMSSDDPRALALYMRAGMRPQWPQFSLLLADNSQARLPTTTLEVVEAQANDPALLDWDARVCGRYRPEDHAYWQEKQRGQALWFKRADRTVGYGYVRSMAQILTHPTAWALGPIGAATDAEAAACVLAAVDWARPRSTALYIEVPGPHPCLTPLLEARFQIQYCDIYMNSASEPLFDPTRYVASGSDLF